jgi:hypothetical protein
LRLREPRAPGDALVVLVAWLGLNALGVAAGGHFSDHYFIQVVAPLALLGGTYLGRHGSRVWVGAILTFGVGLMTFAAVADPVTFTPFWRRPRPDFDALAKVIAARTTTDDRVFVWGNAPSLYVLSNRLPTTRFVGFLRGLHRSEGESPAAAWDAGPEVWPLLAADFARHPPALIVDTASGNFREFARYPLRRFPEVDALVTRDYVVDGQVEGATIYRRR